MLIAQKQYEKMAEGGSRRLFDFEGYRLLDAVDSEDHQSYILIDYDEDHFHSITLKEAYGLVAIYLSVQNGDVFEQTILDAIEQVIEKKTT
ncbi:hypothetical protein [Ammoniphilus sp. CFH 90114]|uniref:hypothetical protein n=1 Tax=Ammoniphilus sp. CFH 90114 TaxID=2493665 RepID=UPI00100EE6F1|nr:hypothetical protein [Ammoniphilus sp. CFH 90114]RXT15416.1 hypothetical protein EIZ39_04250 [Ammoniphilus sp. CFH 90114]